MLSVYFAIWYSSITEGPDVVGGLVICEILLSIVIAVAETFVFTVLALDHGVDYLFLGVRSWIFVCSPVGYDIGNRARKGWCD
jgi:hypothetical protein